MSSLRRAPFSLRACSTATLALSLLAAGALKAQADLTVKDGLMLWLPADIGVTAGAGGQVSGWLDQSGNLNNAALRAGAPADESPTLVASAVNNKPALRFDGVDDVLEIANQPTLQPQMGDWTVFFVAKRLAASQGDFPQLIGSRPWVAGSDEGWSVSLSSAGAVGSHYADGTAGHDVPAVLSSGRLSQAAFQMWQVEENRAAGTTTFYANGDLDAARATAMPVEAVDQVDSVYIGREIGGSDNRRANLDLAEVLVYNRVLSKSERESVSSYLSEKYGLGYVPNSLPAVSISSPAPGTSVASPAAVSFAATASDTDGTIRRVEFFANGSLLATAAAPPFSVPVSMISTGAVTLTAVATDNRGGNTTSAPVAITITGSLPPVPMNTTTGLQLWLKADAGVTTDDLGNVSVWADQSPNGNDALQDNALATPPQNFQPLLVPDAANGNPVIRFDGADSFMTVINSPTLQPQSGDWTIIFAGQRGNPSQGDWPQIIGSRPWAAALDAGWSLSFNGGSGLLGSHFADGLAGHDTGGAVSAAPLSASAIDVWQVEENRTSGFTGFYRLGLTNRVLETAMPSGAVAHVGDLYLGRDIEGSDNRRANLDLAEILVYNRMLNAEERAQTTSYLLRKYAVQQIFNQNPPPAVNLTSPAEGLTFNAPANLNLAVNATDDGAVVSVAYYRGNSLLGIATNSPFGLRTALTGLGDSLLTAVATDNLGSTSTSAPVAIRVVSPGIQLIGKVDYSDTFTINSVRTNGLYNDNHNGAYQVENPAGNPAVVWTPFGSFSFNTPASSTDPGKVSAATGNAGAAGGLAQTGGGDFSLTYGLQSNYVVQIDAILPTDRLDISTLPTAGGGIFAGNSLTIFFRRDSATTLPGVGLFNGTTETGVTNASGAFVRTGVNDNNWHSFAVQFNQPDQVVRVYVDGVLLSTINLATFAGGIYQNFSNGAVGAGGDGGVFWLDNFKVGAPPELITTVDFSDSFTLGEVRMDGLVNDDSGGAYTIENSHANPPVTWTPASAFGFYLPASTAQPDLVSAASANRGAETGLLQFTGGDASIGYGLRSNYVVQFDAILPSDRLDISSVPEPGAGIFAANSLSLFLRRDSAAGTPHNAFPETGLPAIGLYNGTKETAVTDAAGNLIFTGVDDNNWHNFAAHFNQETHELGFYVDRILKATVNLATFADGIYDNYSNGAVGMGGASLGAGNFWVDNFKVGAPAAQPPARVSLVIARDQSGAVITWTGAGTLESADQLNGTWTPIANATSPYPVTTTGTAKYYRLKQ